MKLPQRHKREPLRNYVCRVVQLCPKMTDCEYEHMLGYPRMRAAKGGKP